MGEIKWREVTDPDETIPARSTIRIERTLLGYARRTSYLPDDRIFVRVEPPKVGDLIESVEGLESLPYRSVVLDSGGDAWQRLRIGWRCPGFNIANLEDYAPFTVIHVGGGRDV